MYFYLCDEADKFFDLVPKNISQGKHQEEQDTVTEPPTSTSHLHFSQKMSSRILNDGAGVFSPVNTDTQSQQIRNQDLYLAQGWPSRVGHDPPNFIVAVLQNFCCFRKL